MSKTPYRPTGKGDQTRAERSARREALLNVAARRMGVESWSTLGKMFRATVENAGTDIHAQMGIIALLGDLANAAGDKLKDCTLFSSPEDVAEALATHPKKKNRKFTPMTIKEILDREG